MAITSPTFGLVHELTQGRLPIVHADLYRLGKGSEVVELGLLDRIGNDAVVLVEWGDRFADELGDGLWLCLRSTARQRSAHLWARGPRARQLLEETRVAAERTGLIAARSR